MAKSDPPIWFETEPGRQVQADFATIRRGVSGARSGDDAIFDVLVFGRCDQPSSTPWREGSRKKTMTPERPKARGGIYRSVHIRVWLDEKFKKLTAAQPNAQTLWFYLLFGDQTGIVPGLFKAGGASLEETAITGHVLYDTRHTYASTLLARCRDFVYVAAQLGHASPKTTMDHYAHLLPGVDQNYADFLDESEADWQRFGSRWKKQCIEIEKPIESV